MGNSDVDIFTTSTCNVYHMSYWDLKDYGGITMEEKTKEFYNKQISELYRIIDNYEGIVRDYATLVTSMQEEINKANKEILKYLNDYKSIKGSCEELGRKCEAQRKELQYLNRSNQNLRHKLDTVNQYIKSEYFRNKKYALTPDGHKIISTYTIINEARKKELNTKG